MPGAYKTLTAKQEAFCQAYWECKVATDAYAKVYNVANMKRATIQREAHRLLDNENVLNELERIKAANHKQTTITVHDLVKEQEQAMALAAETRNATAFAAASMNKAKLLGLLVERQEVRTGAIDPDEARPDIAELWSRVTPAVTQAKDSETKH